MVSLEIKGRNWIVYLLLFAGYAFLSIGMTWPLICHMGTHMTGGTGDPLLTCWYLDWNINRYLNLDFRHFFDGNIFYPQKLTLAYSEDFIATALLGVPFYILSRGNIVFTYNVMVILNFTLTALGMHLLVRRLTGRHLPAVVGAIIFTFAPFKIWEMAHLHMITTQWIPFIFLFLHRFIETKKLADCLFFAVFFILNALSSVLYFIFAMFGVFLFGLVMVRHIFKAWREYLKPAVPCAVLIMLVLLPLMTPYLVLNRQMNFQRGKNVNVLCSARLESYIATPSWQGPNLIYGRLFGCERFDKGFHGAMFPGTLALVCAASFLVMAVRKRFSWESQHTFYAVLTVVSFIMSFGPVLDIGSGYANPVYNLFFDHFPGARSMRTPGRFGLLVMFGLSVLAACSVRQWMDSASTRRRLVLAILPAVCVLEYVSVPIELEAAPVQSPVPAVYAWLRDQPGRVPVLELPSNSFLHNVKYVFHSRLHRKEIVNGYSSFHPPLFSWKLDGPPARVLEEEPMEVLREIGVTYLIVHEKLMKKNELADFRKVMEQQGTNFVSSVARFNKDVVYEIRGHKPAGSAPTSLAEVADKISVKLPSIVPPGWKCRGMMEMAGPLPVPVAGLYTVPMDRKLAVEFKNTANGKTMRSVCRLGDPSEVRKKMYPVSFTSPAVPGTYEVFVYSTGKKISEAMLSVKKKQKTSLAPGQLNSKIAAAWTELTAAPKAPVSVKARLTNTGDTLWLSRISDNRDRGEGEVRLAYRIICDSNEVAQGRAFLPHDIGPGQSAELELRFTAPSQPGTYRVKLDMVDEMISWFEEKGSEPAWLELTVR